METIGILEDLILASSKKEKEDEVNALDILNKLVLADTDEDPRKMKIKNGEIEFSPSKQQWRINLGWAQFIIGGEEDTQIIFSPKKVQKMLEEEGEDTPKGRAYKTLLMYAERTGATIQNENKE